MDDSISRQAAIDAFMTATSDGDKADWCKYVLKQLPSAQPEPCEDAVGRDVVVRFLDDWISALDANCHHQSMADLKIVKNDFKNLPSTQPCMQTCKSMYADVSDLVSRQAAIYAVNTALFPKINTAKDAEKALMALPSAQSSLITWLLDEIWDEEMWELNWQAFPELLCRKLEKLGYVKRTGDEYERLDR